MVRHYIHVYLPPEINGLRDQVLWTIFFPTQLNLLFVPFNCVPDATNKERLILASNNAIVCYEDWEHTLMSWVAGFFWFFLAGEKYAPKCQKVSY